MLYCFFSRLFLSRSTLVLLLSISCFACSPITGNNCGNNCGTTQESIEEFTRTGATFANEYSIALDSINVQLEEAEETSFYLVPVELHMQPAVGDTDYKTAIGNRRDLYRVYYSGKVGANEEFERYPASTVQIVFDTHREDLHISSDFTVSHSGSQYVPTTYTHVELWYRDSTAAEFSLVRRVKLEDLWMWRKYILQADF